MPTVEDRLASLEERMDEQERLRLGQDEDQSDFGLKLATQDKMLKTVAKTHSEHIARLRGHTAILDKQVGILERHAESLDRHTAMRQELRDRAGAAQA